MDAGDVARTHFEGQWQRGDTWNLDADLDRRSRSRQLELVADRRYPRVLEIGCGAGAFTKMLATVADEVLAIDIAPSAIDQARSAGAELPGVELRAANALELDVVGEGPWDLVVMSETIYCLGWVYPLFEIGWWASQVHAAISPGGRLLMANTYGHDRDYLLLPWLINTYRDLLLNIGFGAEQVEHVRGQKGGYEYEVLISLFARTPGPAIGSQPDR